MQEGLVALAPYAADLLVLLGVAIITIGVYGALRMPDTYLKLHSSSVVVAFGMMSIAAAALFTGLPAIAARVVLIVAVVGVTAPIAAFAMARAAFLRDEPLADDGSLDESGHHLAQASSRNHGS